MIPFWQLVYHGITLSNPYTRTVNAPLSNSPDTMLKLIEYGGRPALYYYSSFVNKQGANWMGDGSDFTCDTPEEQQRCADAAKTHGRNLRALSLPSMGVHGAPRRTVSRCLPGHLFGWEPHHCRLSAKNVPAGKTGTLKLRIDSVMRYSIYSLRRSSFHPGGCALFSPDAGSPQPYRCETAEVISHIVSERL